MTAGFVHLNIVVHTDTVIVVMFQLGAYEAISCLQTDILSIKNSGAILKYTSARQQHLASLIVPSAHAETEECIFMTVASCVR